MSTIPSFTSLFLENDNYVCIIRDILRIQNESCYNEDFIHVPVEKCWTIWTIVNANNIINKDFPCYKGVSLRMLTHIADLLMNIKYYPLTIKPGKKEVEKGALNDIIAKIKEEYVTVAKILKSLIDSNIKNGYDYLIRVVCEALPEMKEYLIKSIDNHIWIHNNNVIALIFSLIIEQFFGIVEWYISIDLLQKV